MTLLKKLLVSVMLLGASAGAQAKNHRLVILSPGYNGLVGNFSSGSFLDKLPYTLGNNYVSNIGALNLTVGGVSASNISGLNFSLFDNNGNILGSGLDFTVNNLHARNFYLQVSGTADGVGGGLFAGGINLSPVPEPGTLNSLLVGLAVIGFMTYRRRSMY